MKKISSAIIIMFTMAMSVQAAVPVTINYQGRLTDSAGIAVADSSYGITISFWNSLSGGTQLWSENHTVTTKKGYFTALLGSITTFAIAGLDFNSQYYLEMWVSGEPSAMTPRKPLSSIPYAMRAEHANQVTDNSITGSKIVDGAVTNSDIADNTITSNKIVDRSIISSDIAAENITWNEIADGTIRSYEIGDGQVTSAKAPWAPTVNGGISNPKIVTGMIGTDKYGDMGVTIYGFSNPPIVVATPNRHDINVVVRVYNITATGFALKSVDLSGAGAECLVNWIAIGN